MQCSSGGLFNWCKTCFYFRSHEQLLVLVSRVRSLKDLYFVGDPHQLPGEIREETLTAMKLAINRNCEFTEYIAAMLRHLDYFEMRHTSVQVQLPALNFIHQEIPRDDGVVYMLISQKNPEDGYVGQTNELGRRLREHNSLGGNTKQTRNGKPWVVAVLVCGFPSGVSSSGRDINQQECLSFESDWKRYNNNRMTDAKNSKGMMRNGEAVFKEWKNKKNYGKNLYPDLKWIKMVELTETGKQVFGTGDLYMVLLTAVFFVVLSEDTYYDDVDHAMMDIDLNA